MLPRAVKSYFFTSRIHSFELILGLLFFFFVLALGSVYLPLKLSIAVLGAGIACFLVLLGPVVNFAIYFPTTFFGSISLPMLPFSLNQVVGIVFVLSCLLWIFKGKGRIPRGRTRNILAILFFCFLLNCLLALDLEASLHHARYLVIYFFITLVLASLVTNKKQFRFFCWVILLYSSMSALIGAFELVTGIGIFNETTSRWMGRMRIDGVAPNSIVFAYQLLYAFPIGYYLFSEEKSVGLRFLALGLALFMTLIAIFTFNRQSILLIGAAYFLAAILYKNRYSKIFTGLVIAMAFLLSPYVLHTILMRMRTIGDLYRDRSLSLRIDGIKVGWNMIRERPFRGIGLGCYPKVWWKYLPIGETRTLHYYKLRERYPDMGYNQLFCEGGLICFALAMLFFLHLVRTLWKHRRRALEQNQRNLANIYTALFVQMTVFLLSSAIQDTFLYVRTWIMFAFILAVTRGSFTESDEGTRGGEGESSKLDPPSLKLRRT